MRYIINGQLIVLLLFLSCSNYEKSDLFTPSAYPDRVILSWETDPSSSRSVTWRTNTSVEVAYAELAVADPSPDFRNVAKRIKAVTRTKSIDSVSANFHSVRFDSLLPSTLYIYKVGSENYWSEWFQFRTPDEGDDAFSFLYLGDAQNDMREMCARNFRQAYSHFSDVDFMLHAGDLVNHANNNSEWGGWFDAGSWVFSVLPQIIVPGNHEYDRKDFDSTAKFISDFWDVSFSLPCNGPDGLDELAYYFDFKNARFVVINTQHMMFREENAILQSNWLEGLLKDNDKEWTIVCQHHPIYSARGNRGSYSIKQYLQPLFEKYKVDLVLEGHHHSYARGRNPAEIGKNFLEGPVYVVSVSGPKMYDSAFEEWMERVATNVQLYHRIKVNSDKLVLESYLVDGSLYDGFIISHQQDGRKRYAEILPENVIERTSFPQSSYGADVVKDPEYIKEYQQKAEEYKIKLKKRR